MKRVPGAVPGLSRHYKINLFKPLPQTPFHSISSCLHTMAYTYKPDLLAPFLALPQGDKIQAECKSHVARVDMSYLNVHTDVWVDGDGGLRSKTTVSKSLYARPALVRTGGRGLGHDRSLGVRQRADSDSAADRHEEGDRYRRPAHLGLRRLVDEPGARP
jgi:hypothetical protein